MLVLYLEIMDGKSLQHQVFWPSVVVVCGAAIYSLADPESFVRATGYINSFLLNTFDWLYGSSVLLFLGLVVIIYTSPLGTMYIGGKKSKPELTKFRWFAITLSTTIASGILFWGPIEPLFHLHEPPPAAGAEPGSYEAARFAMSTVYMHWTFIPYAMYTLAGLAFAIGFYNMKGRFQLSALLLPLLGKRVEKWSSIIDIISLFSLVAGMAASLGAGILVLTGGLSHLFGFQPGVILLGILTVIIVMAFIFSAISGLQKGIRILSTWNVRIFIVIALSILLLGPTAEILQLAGQGLWDFVFTFPERSTIGFYEENKEWAGDWTLFNWANWLAWTPITAVFLGRISRGRTVREFIRFNLLYPSLFGIVWMGIFSSSSLITDLDRKNLWELTGSNSNAGEVIFTLFETLPLAQLFSIVYLITAFLSYVTAADSNTSAMSGISSNRVSLKKQEPPKWIQFIWGGTIGIIAWIMISFGSQGETQGLDGIRMLSNLGGFPSLLLELLVAAGMIRLLLNRK